MEVDSPERHQSRVDRVLMRRNRARAKFSISLGGGLAILLLYAVCTLWAQTHLLHGTSEEADRGGDDARPCSFEEGRAPTGAEDPGFLLLQDPTLPWWVDRVEWKNPFQVVRYYGHATSNYKTISERSAGAQRSPGSGPKDIVVLSPPTLLSQATPMGKFFLHLFLTARNLDLQKTNVSLLADPSRPHKLAGFRGHTWCSPRGLGIPRVMFGEAGTERLVEGGPACLCGAFAHAYDPGHGSPRDEWFQSAAQVVDFRARVASVCQASFTKPRGDKRVLILYQRNQNRKIVHLSETAKALEQALGDQWIVKQLTHNDSRPVCELASTIHQSDALVLAHGFASMLTMFQRPGSLLAEIFPYKYYKGQVLKGQFQDAEGYEDVVRKFGVKYITFNSTAQTVRRRLLAAVPLLWCMQSKRCRKFARGGDVVLTAGNIADLHQILQDDSHE